MYSEQYSRLRIHKKDNLQRNANSTGCFRGPQGLFYSQTVKRETKLLRLQYWKCLGLTPHVKMRPLLNRLVYILKRMVQWNSLSIIGANFLPFSRKNSLADLFPIYVTKLRIAHLVSPIVTVLHYGSNEARSCLAILTVRSQNDLCHLHQRNLE